MRTVLTILLLIAALMAWANGPCVAEKVTADPNAVIGSGAPDEDSTKKTDSRLDQKVTAQFSQQSVLAILAELTEKTGVKFKAGTNAKDWQVRDRRMCIFAKDTPLRDIMVSMARVMKFKWTRDGKDGDYTYRLYMSRRAQLDADERAQRDEEEKQKRLVDKRTKALDAYAKTANLSPQELAKLKDSNPFLYAIGKTGVLKSMSAFLNESPETVEAFTNGKPLTLNSGNLSAGGQQAILRTMQELWKLETRLGNHDRAFPDGLADNLSQLNIQINRRMDDMQMGPETSFMLGEMTMGYGGEHVDLPLFDPDSNMAKLMGKVITESLEQDRRPEEIMRDGESDFVKAVTADIKNGDTGDPAPEHQDEPDLHKKIKLKVEHPSLSDVQSELAKASEMAVVSDSFGQAYGIMQRFVTLSGDEQELQTVLDKIAEGYSYNWEKHGSVLEFRDRQWYVKRTAQLPDSLLDTWRNTLKKTGTLGIDALAQIASLTKEQATTNIQSDPVFQHVGLPWSLFSAKDILKLYAILDEQQQAAMLSTGGLDLRLLSPEQWTFAEKLVMSRDSSYLMNPDSKLLLSTRRTPQGKQISYDFSLSIDGEVHSGIWSVLTPLYVEPPKEEEPKTQQVKTKAETATVDKSQSAK